MRSIAYLVFILLVCGISQLVVGARRAGGRSAATSGNDRNGAKTGRKVKNTDNNGEPGRRKGKKRHKKSPDSFGGSLTDFSVDEHGNLNDVVEYSDHEMSDKGYAHLGRGEISAAIEIFSRNGDHYGLSLCYTAGPERDLRNALRHATEALKDNPSFPAGYYQRSRLAGFLGFFDILEADILALVGLGAEIPMLESHAQSFKGAQFCTASIKVLEVLLDMTSDPVKMSQYYLNIGLCKEELGDSQSAYDYIRKALALDGASVDPLHSSNLSRYLLDLGRIDEAIKLSIETIRNIENELAKLNRRNDAQRIEALEYAVSKHYRVAVVIFQELGKPFSAIESAKKIKFGGVIDFVAAVVAIDSYQAVADYPPAIDLVNSMLSQATQVDLRGLLRYRREITYINYCSVDLPFTAYNIDTLVDTRIKHARTKVFGIPDEFVDMETYTEFWQQCAIRRAAHESVYGRGSRTYDNTTFFESIKSLSEITSGFRETLQLNSSGFYKHDRKDRMMGFSAIEMNQLLRRHMRCIIEGYDGLLLSNRAASKSEMVSVNRIAAEIYAPILQYPSFCGERTDERDEVRKKFHAFEWRDLFDVGVRWRQLAEPTDPVWWMDRFDEFKGNGSDDTVSTPLQTGQKKVSRYYTYMNESLALFKKTMRHCYSTENVTCIRLSADQKAALERSTTLEELYAIHRGSGSVIYVVANCTSAVHMDQAIPCTKFYLSPSRSNGEGWDYRISATYTTDVYESYFSDLDILFQRYINKIIEIHSTKEISVREKLIGRIIDDILDILYTWVHCSPLSRGSASLGYTSTVALFLAADICPHGRFPPGKQLDWEVLLSTTPRDFKARVWPWFNDILSYPISSACPQLTEDWLEGVTPGRYSMAELFPTARHVLEGLSVDVL